jgi:YhcH/YjgK/YiaL family protein
MILDTLDNISLYRGLPARLVAALDFLQATDLAALPLGKTTIDGERLFALVQEYSPKRAEMSKFEAHRRFWDVQYVARGIERIGYSHLSRMSVSEPHSLERDVSFFTGPGDWLYVPAGTFVVFGPSDVHMPGVAFEAAADDGREQSLVRKVVVKVEL